jgi:hypothetical protein
MADLLVDIRVVGVKNTTPLGSFWTLTIKIGRIEE